MKILFENREIIVCIKPAGICSQESKAAENMPEIIRKHLNDSNRYVGVIHRLDTAVSGVMVYAKTKAAAASLSQQTANNALKKEYWAVVSGIPEASGMYEDLLFKDSSKNKSYVVNRIRTGVKKAKLEYTLLRSAVIGNEPVSLVKILLHTGRTHQIRVQFSHRKMPLLGDRKYGSKFNCPIALFSHKLSFLLPDTGELKEFSAVPGDVFPFNIFKTDKP